MISQLEGTGCSASISFKTYYETEEVRVCCESGWASISRRTRSLNGLSTLQIALSIRTRLVSRTSLSREEAAGPRSNRRKPVQQDDVRTLNRTGLRPPPRRSSLQERFSISRNQISIRSHLISKTLRLNKRLTPLYSLTTPRHNSHL